MRWERFVTKGNETTWPIRFKIGLFRTRSPSFVFVTWVRHGGCNARKRPALFWVYLRIPYLFTFWVSFEKDVISICYCDFLGMPPRKPFTHFYEPFVVRQIGTGEE